MTRAADLEALSARSDASGLRQLALHLGALVSCGVLLGLSLGTPWSIPALAFYATALVFLFAAEHECLHGTAFSSRRLNEWVARACGFVLVLPAGYFRHFHFAHHRHTQDPDRDPELAAPGPRSRAGYALTVSGLPHWRERIVTSLRHARGRVSEEFVPGGSRRAIVREARAALAGYALIAIGALSLGSWAPLTFWIAPLVVGQPVLRLFLLAEHTGRPHVPDMLVNTRSIDTNALLRRLAWNMPYHAEHHAHPGVPFHALPALRAALGTSAPSAAPGYTAVHRELLAELRAPAT